MMSAAQIVMMAQHPATRALQTGQGSGGVTFSTGRTSPAIFLAVRCGHGAKDSGRGRAAPK
jgi:hypothetical protein